MAAAKPLSKRQSRSTPAVGLVAIDGTVGKVPAVDDRWLVGIKAEWRALWVSPLANTYLPTDVTALRRLYDVRDERERCARSVRRHRLVDGSQGQAVLNPLGRLIPTFDAEIRQLEDRFGLNPAARLKLGIVFGQAAKTLKELNDDFDDDDDGAGFDDL